MLGNLAKAGRIGLRIVRQHADLSPPTPPAVLISSTASNIAFNCVRSTYAVGPLCENKALSKSPLRVPYHGFIQNSI